MTSIRSSLLLLLLLVSVTVAACGEEEPTAAQEPPPPTVRHPFVRALDDPDPAVRRHAAEGLGRLQNAPPEVARALLAAQDDADATVAAAAVAALDAIHPGADVALRVFGDECYETVEEQVCVRSEHLTWRKVECNLAASREGTQRGACWLLALIPAVYETRNQRVLVTPGAARWRDAREVRAGDAPRVCSEPPPPPLRRTKRQIPPEGEPEGAQPGEVWCRHESETETGGTWRRHPECEGPGAAR